jgi:ParB family chromosome partitioning protein
VAVSNLIRLLDLPDESLAALEQGQLTEGHGRALLLATDHDERRRLTRTAVQHGWSVRELESRAREANGTVDRPARRPVSAPALHPDQEAAMAQLHDTYGAALGREVDVKPLAGGGYRIQLSFTSVDEALELAAQLRR